MSRKISNETDIYRKTAIGQHSPEHVLQAGLRCDLEVIGLIDHGTNIALGSTIDRHFIEDFAFVRSRLGLSTRRGDPIRIETSSGDYDLRGDVPVPKRSANNGLPWTSTTLPNGRTLISISSDTIERAATLSHHARRALGLGDKEPIEIEARQTRKYLPPVGIELSIGGPAHHRAVAKACLNALALRVGPKVLLEERFDPIRQYILHAVDHCDELMAGAVDPFPAFACFDSRQDILRSLPVGSGFGPLDHRLVIRAVKATRVAYATVELFGNIPYSVLLTDDWPADDICWALIADPRIDGGGYRLADLALEIRPPLTRAEVLAHSTDLDSLRPNLQRLLALLSSITEDRVFDAIAGEVFDSVLGEQDGKPLTSEQVGHLAREMAVQLVKQVHRIDSETPLAPPVIQSKPK